MWIFPWIKLSWHSCSMWDKLGWLNWFWQFLCEGLYSFNPKRFYYSYARSCSFCVTRTSFCMRLISTKIWIRTSIFAWLYFTQSLTSFFSINNLPCHYAVFDFISSNIDEVLLIKPSANVLIFQDFNVHHKDRLTYSGGTDTPGKLCYIFSISNDLTQIVNFPTWVLTVTITVLLFWIYFSSDASICSIMLLSWFPLTSQWIQNKKSSFTVQLMTIIVLTGMIFAITWEMFHGRITLKLVFLLLLVNFVSGSGWSWWIHPSSQVSGQTSFISMAFSSLCCCHSS